MSKNSNGEYEVKDHQLSVSSFGSLYKLLKDNRVSWKYRNKVAKILAWTVLTQPFHLLQKIVIYPKLNSVDFDKVPPIFVIGHWRSGTTHLHYMLSRDPQFGFLTNYQSLFMRMSFVTDGIMDKVLDHYMPETRPQDNIKMGAYEPAEEEQPLTNLTECSGMQSFYFPQNISYFNKYNLFKGISAIEKKNWKEHYSYMLKLISLANNNKPLILKNPHNTGRVKELLELYPNGKFIFIHRDPIDVYYSNMHLYKKMISTQFLQDFSEDEISERVIYGYKAILKKYLKDRNLIPKNNLIELSYKELEMNPMNTLELIYKTLNIPNYDQAISPILNYLNTTDDYKKNSFDEIEPKIVNRLKKDWAFAFKEWNYPLPN